MSLDSALWMLCGRLEAACNGSLSSQSTHFEYRVVGFRVQGYVSGFRVTVHGFKVWEL